MSLPFASSLLYPIMLSLEQRDTLDNLSLPFSFGQCKMKAQTKTKEFSHEKLSINPNMSLMKC